MNGKIARQPFTTVSTKAIPFYEHIIIITILLAAKRSLSTIMHGKSISTSVLQRPIEFEWKKQLQMSIAWHILYLTCRNFVGTFVCVGMCVCVFLLYPTN